MPLTYSLDFEQKLVTIIGTGDVTMKERHAAVNELMNHAAPDGHWHCLLLVSGITNHLQADEIFEAGFLLNRLKSRFYGRLAIVDTRAGHVTLTNLVAMTATNMGADNTLRSFMSKDAARIWLHSPERRTY